MATRSSVKVDFRAMVYGICEFQRLKIIHDDLKLSGKDQRSCTTTSQPSTLIVI